MKIFLPLFLLLLVACQSESNTPAKTDKAKTPMEVNPAAKGFNLDESDPRAIALADSVMLAMGGRQAWDNTRFLRWDFFGRRRLTWDKLTNKVRIDFLDQNIIVSANTSGTKGWVYKDGGMVESIDESVKWVKKAREIWINDSYWLVMPFKLKDSGVMLKHLGTDTTSTGAQVEVLQLTFSEVGVTPENKYHVYVDPETWLVSEWAYFAKTENEKPDIVTPWNDYKRYGDVLIASGRGDKAISNVSTIPDLGPEFFNDPGIKPGLD